MKVFVKFFSKVNLGDDLFLKILFERYPKIQFSIIADNRYKAIFKEYNNVLIINDVKSRRNALQRFFNRVYLYLVRKFIPSLYPVILRKVISRQYLKIFKEHSAFISIGGSIFMQPNRLPAYGSIELYRLAQQNIDKVFFIGCNFGPYLTESFRKEYEEMFEKAEDVCFRDDASKELFASLENVRVAPDVVFNLEIQKAIKLKRSVGFSVVTPRGETNAVKYIENYVALVKFYLERNYQVYFFSFCSAQGDEEIIDLILGKINVQSNISKISYRGNISSFISSYSRVEKMYCGRFHAMILSMLCEQKFYPVIYSDKMTNVLNDLGYTGSSVKIEDFFQMNPSELDIQLAKCEYDITDAIRLSNNQFSKLDELLKQNTE